MAKPYRIVRCKGPNDDPNSDRLADEVELIKSVVGLRRLRRIVVKTLGTELTRDEALQIGIRGLEYYRIERTGL